MSDPDEPVDAASPPCLLGETNDDIDPAYFGFLRVDEQIEFLNILLEAERAGARGLAEMARRCDEPELCAALREIATDEASFCVMLTCHIERLKGEPSHATGAFYDKLLARGTLAEQLDLLDRGQGWVVEKLRETLPKLPPSDLRIDLRDMMEVHEVNIARARVLAAHQG